jgi:hypothetical protein
MESSERSDFFADKSAWDEILRCFPASGAPAGDAGIDLETVGPRIPT